MTRTTVVAAWAATFGMAALLCLAIALPGGAIAQQKQQVSYKIPAENSKFTQQLNIDAGDVPNHIVRVYELHTIFPNNAPAINGLRVVELWNRGIADFSDGNGPTTSYHVYVMENGDKFFVRGGSVTQSTSGKLAVTSVGQITGGTGKLASIQGIERLVSTFDLKGGTGDTQIDIEYSIGK